MKHKVIRLPCLFIISLIALHFFVPATLRASESPIIGALHSEAYPDATMMKNSFEKYASAPDYYAAEAYSALMVAADVLKRADSFSPESIRAALDQTDMMTPFGPVKFISYENFERQNRLPTQVLQIINGKFECVWPQELATANFTAPPEWKVND